jgi:hypothetical protein
MNYFSHRRDRYHHRNPRFSRQGVYFSKVGRETFALTAWPDLASFRNSGWHGSTWEPDRQAGNRVYAAFHVAKPSYHFWADTLCEAATGQVVIPSFLTTGEARATESELAAQAASHVHTQWQHFIATIPPALYATAFPFLHNRLAVLRLLAVCPEAKTLADENPSVFFELCCHFDRSISPKALRPQILEMLRGPQSDILAVRGLPNSESARRLFRKLPKAHICSPHLLNLGRALADKAIGKWLPHITPPSSHIAHLLSDSSLWPYLTPQLTTDLVKPCGYEEDPEVAEIFQRFAIRDALKQLRWFDRQVRRGLAARRRFRTSKELASLPDLPEQLRGLAIPIRTKPAPFRKPFPAAPIPGTEEVVPITSYEELLAEGASQKNCAGAPYHVLLLKERKAYFYRVLELNGLERCTAMIERRSVIGKKLSWVITELRAYSGAIPRRSTLQGVANALGLPARPDWFPQGAWFCEDENYVCVPRK